MSVNKCGCCSDLYLSVAVLVYIYNYSVIPWFHTFMSIQLFVNNILLVLKFVCYNHTRRCKQMNFNFNVDWNFYSMFYSYCDQSMSVCGLLQKD